MVQRGGGAELDVRWLLAIPLVFIASVLGLLVTVGAPLLDPGVVVLLAVVAIAAVMPRSAGLRLPVQAAVVVTTVVLMVQSGWRAVDVGWSVAALVAVAGVVDRSAAVLASLQAEQAADRARLERRLDLLAAMEDLPVTHDEAVAATVRILLAQGFDAAAVSFVRDGMLHAELLAGVADPGPLPPGRGLAGRAIRRDRTVVTGDYEREPDRLEGVSGARAVIVAPVRVGGRPVGVVMCDRHAAGLPTDTEVEVAEVLAAHLGGVLSTLERERRQAELRRRAARLDELRTHLIAAVSDEVRAPIAEVHGAVAGLGAQAAVDVPPSPELTRLRAAAGDLASTVSAVLLVARRRLESTGGRARSVVLAELVAEVTAVTGTAASWPDAEADAHGRRGAVADVAAEGRRTEVADVGAGTDERTAIGAQRVWLVPSLCLHAVELLVDAHGGSGTVAVEVVAAPSGVELQLEPPTGTRPPPVVVALATNLFAAAGVEPLSADALRLRLSPPPEEELG